MIIQGDCLEKLKEIERCGFCGSYFRGTDFISIEELKKHTKEELDNAPLGYCPNANYEAQENLPQRYITRDMAIDAGYPEMEGQPYNF